MIESLPSDDYSALAKRWYAHQIRPRGKSWLPAIFEKLESQGRTVTGREPSKPSFVAFDECAEISATVWANLDLARREAGRLAILRACRDFIASFKG